MVVASNLTVDVSAFGGVAAFDCGTNAVALAADMQACGISALNNPKLLSCVIDELMSAILYRLLQGDQVWLGKHLKFSLAIKGKFTNTQEPLNPAQHEVAITVTPGAALKKELARRLIENGTVFVNVGPGAFRNPYRRKQPQVKGLKHQYGKSRTIGNQQVTLQLVK